MVECQGESSNVEESVRQSVWRQCSPRCPACFFHTPAGVRQATCDDWLRAVRVAGVRGVKRQSGYRTSFTNCYEARSHRGEYSLQEKFPSSQPTEEFGSGAVCTTTKSFSAIDSPSSHRAVLPYVL